MIFRSGKLVCTGAKSVEGVYDALESTFDTLGDLRLRVNEDPTITVQNIVVTGDLGETLNLNAIAIAIALGLETIEYEPEQFLGLVIDSTNPMSSYSCLAPGKP